MWNGAAIFRRARTQLRRFDMGNRLLFGLMGAILLVAASSRSDVATPLATPTTEAAPEPITGSAAVAASGSDVFVRDPYAPTDPGPPEATIPYSDLTPDEQAVADKGRDLANDP